MAKQDRLGDFVAAALAAGRGREEIAAALTAAGWSEAEAAKALGDWAEGGFTPPVPRPRDVVSARDFFVWGLVFIALGVVAVNAVNGLHALINLYAPGHPTDYRMTSAPSSLRWAAASLVVFGPVYWLLLRGEARARAADPARYRSALKRWVSAAVLLITVLVLLGTLAGVIYQFLGGEADLAFLLKSAAVALVGGIVMIAWRRTDAA